MKFFSDKTHKMYETVDALESAEKEFDEKAAKELALREERKARAAEVEEAYKKYLDLRTKFVEEYKSYHMTITEKDLPKTTSLFDIFDSFWF